MTSAVLTAPPSTVVAAPAGPGARWRWWRLALLTAGISCAAVALRGHLPDPASIWTALRPARPGWLVAAVVLATVSMGAFAEQQRQLLAAFGVRMAAPASLAVSYARSAIAIALPGGSAVSAGYAFRQFRAWGASQPAAAAVMVLSGVASFVGLVLLYAGGLLAWTSPSVGTLAILAAAAVVLTLVVATSTSAAAVSPPARAVVATGAEPAAASSAVARLGGALRHTILLGRTVPARRWLAVVALAALNWLTDLACLLVALQAIGLAVPVRTVATAYLAAQLIRQIPVTPGGIGVIEASLILALTTAGAAPAPAAAAVLVYRLLSCWSVLPIGLTCWLTQRGRAAVAVRPVSVGSNHIGWSRRPSTDGGYAGQRRARRL